ncbi:MAG: hypothetical protein GX640_06095, partial [Fibrobacter sp.]|nr:hypothetical protein [Fibrobacter sp.]
GGDGHTITWETDRFEETLENYGSIILKNGRFGLFSRIESRGLLLQSVDTVSGIAGRDIPLNLQPSLTLSGHVGGLILYNGSSIDGQVVLHHGDIYRERRGRPLSEYQNRLIIRESPSLPFDSLAIPKLFEQLNNAHISLLSSKNVITANVLISNPKDTLFKNDTIVVLGNCLIDGGPLQNKTLVVSGMLMVQRNALIQLCRIYAEKVTIEDGMTDGSVFYSSKNTSINGGEHNSQFFSGDTLLCKKNASFRAMNVLACFQKAKNDSIICGGVNFEPGTRVKGTVICCRDSSARRVISGPAIVFGRGCVFTGVAVTDYDIDILEMQVKGHIWARSITTSDSGKSYTNFLINSSIKRPDEQLFFPLIGGLPVEVKVKKTFF